VGGMNLINFVEDREQTLAVMYEAMDIWGP
jgi:hypothetical protein